MHTQHISDTALYSQETNIPKEEWRKIEEGTRTLTPAPLSPHLLKGYPK